MAERHDLTAEASAASRVRVATASAHGFGGPAGADLEAADAADADAHEDEFEDRSKAPRHRRHRRRESELDAAPRGLLTLLPPSVGRREVVAYVGGWLLMAALCDPPFALYWFYGTAVALHVARAHLVTSPYAAALPTTSMLRSRWAFRVAALAIIVIGHSIYAFLAPFDLPNVISTFNLPALSELIVDPPRGAASVGGPHVAFVRMHNPKLDYTASVDLIHAHMNRERASGTSMTRLQLDLDTWSSDVLRYEFLLHFWRQLPVLDDVTANASATGSSPPSRIACLVESDIAFNETFIAEALQSAEPSLELAHSQHFWGHAVFEPYNIGILCASSGASWKTRLWVRVMRSLHSKRYRRLLVLGVLFAVVPNRFVLLWDRYFGCSEYYPHCRYVHFTRPKIDGIEASLARIEARDRRP